MAKADDIDAIFASSKGKGKGKAPAPAPPPSAAPAKKKKKDKKRKRDSAADEAPAAEPPSRKRVVETVVDPSSTTAKATHSVPAATSKTKPSKKPKPSADDEKFKDSKGSRSRRQTDEGWSIYKVDELGIDETAGDTPLCPFDCDCCKPTFDALHSLPNELLGEILAHAMLIPDALFMSTASRSPFAKYDDNYVASRLLLVNSAWRAAGAAPLYHDVVLRSAAQAKALAHTLADAPDLVRLVRRLRIESGFGRDVQAVLEAAEGITDLCLLTPHSGDKVQGVCDALARVNPTRLILIPMDVRGKPNKGATLLLDSLRRTMRQWTNLTTVCFGSYMAYGFSGILGDIPSLPSVRKVVFLTWERAILGWQRALCASPTLDSVEFPCVDVSMKVKDDLLEGAGDVGRAKLRFDEPKPETRPTITPFKMSRRPSREIISLILGYLMGSDHRDTEGRLRLPRNIEVLTVCKEFFNVGLPIFLRDLEFSNRTAEKFIQYFRAHPDRIDHVQTIRLFANISRSVEKKKERFEALLRLGGRYKSIFPMPQYDTEDIYQETYCTLALQNGTTLETLSAIYIKDTLPWGFPHPIALLCHFAHLCDLRWSSKATCPYDVLGPADALPALESLTLEAYHFSFVWALRQMDLPALKTLQLFPGDLDMNSYRSRIGLLNRHGWKLYELSLYVSLDLSFLSLCPNLRRLSHRGEDVNLKMYKGWVYKTVTKIILHDLDANRCAKFLKMLDFDQFPGLREIYCKAVIWPWKESRVADSQLIKFAEHMVATRGVKLYDKELVFWTPRLGSGASDLCTDIADMTI
ncbi:hypothetical protein HDZ31DRAFT_59626 [Schizophyllum fasciatum]